LDGARRLLGSERVAFGAVATLLVFGLIVQLLSMAIPDIAWYLHSGARYLDGGVLYRDIFIEPNPPLGFFLTLPAVILGRFTGLFPVHVFVVYVNFLTVLSLAAVWALLRGDQALKPSARHGLLILAAVVLVICPGNQFGQREHFSILLALPYFLLTARRAVGTGVPVAAAFGIGLAAGLGFALKPHFLLVPLALEFYRLALTRRFWGCLRAENLGLGVALAGYAAVLVLVTPDYLTRIFPYVLAVYNQAYNNPMWINLWRVETVMLPVGCMVHVATRRSQVAPHAGEVFLIASACLFLAYIVQFKGWDYHLYPASSCLILAYGALFLNSLQVRLAGQEATDNAALTRGIAVASLFLIVLIVVFDVVRLGYRSPFTKIAAPYVERYARGGSIAIFGSNVWPGFPLVLYEEVAWSSRFPALWLLPGAIRQRHDGETANLALLEDMETFTRESVIADFIADPPDLVIVDDRAEKSYFGGLTFDYLDYFSTDPRFAQLWADYVWVDEVVDFDFYRRRCAPGC